MPVCVALLIPGVAIVQANQLQQRLNYRHHILKTD